MFQCAVTITINHEQTESYPESTSKIKSFINKYNWKEISFPSHKKDWKKLIINNKKINNKTIALNRLYEPYKSK